jgi:excisionase family DNA binding protein
MSTTTGASAMRAYTIPEACQAARLGRTYIYEAIRRGELRARKAGRRTIILADELREWLEQLPAADSNGGAPDGEGGA